MYKVFSFLLNPVYWCFVVVVVVLPHLCHHHHHYYHHHHMHYLSPLLSSIAIPNKLGLNGRQYDFVSSGWMAGSTTATFCKYGMLLHDNEWHTLNMPLGLD